MIGKLPLSPVISERPIMEATVKQLRVATSAAAKTSKEMALDLVAKGLDGNVTDKFIAESLGGQSTTKRGYLSKNGKQSVFFDLLVTHPALRPKKPLQEITVGDYFDMKINELQPKYSDLIFGLIKNKNN